MAKRLTDMQLLAQIERIRAQNNTLWMDLVRLAVRVAPQEAKAILREIQAKDGAVRRLTQRIAR